MPERLFGKLKKARRPLKIHEIGNFPISRMILNTESQQKIKVFFDAAFEKDFLRGFYENILLIYVVDGRGNIILAIEELFKNDSDNEKLEVKSGVSRFVDHGPHLGLSKLGHPSLLPSKDKQARLAGEIYFRNHVWYINDRSGRYTLSNSENSKYIDNVVTLFSLYGIEIIPAV